MQKRTRPSSIIPGAEPFSLPGGPVGCLLVHGFTSTPYDVRACGEYLSSRGIATEGVLLAGHGTTPHDLSKTTMADWLRSIREAYTRLQARSPYVFALGISLGGNLLVHLSQECSFSGFIPVGMPLYIRHEHPYRAMYYAYRALGIRYQRKWYQRSLDPHIRAERPNYNHIPIACLRDARHTIVWSRNILGAIRCPILAIQSTTDHAIGKRTMEELQKKTGSNDITVQWFPNRYHVVLIDHGKEEVFEAVHTFIKTRSPMA